MVVEDKKQDQLADFFIFSACNHGWCKVTKASGVLNIKKTCSLSENISFLLPLEFSLYIISKLMNQCYVAIQYFQKII